MSLRSNTLPRVGALLPLALTTGALFAASLDPAPDTVLVNGKILTVDADFTIVEALAIKDGRFVGVGDNEEIRALAGTATEVRDLEGRTVVPGLIDAHAHMDREGLKFIHPSLTGARSIEDILRIVEREVARSQPGEWIITMPVGDHPYYANVPQVLAEGRYPNRWDLDRVSPNNPVYIRGIWYFWRSEPPIVAIANTRALELAGITRDTLPPHPGLQIVKDASGEPTGVFIESGTLGTMEFSLMRAAPRFTHEERVEALRESMRRYNAAGTTGVFEGHGVSSVVMNAYKELWGRGEMTVRSTLVVSPAWSAVPEAAIGEVLRDWSTYAGGSGIGDDMLELSGIYAAVGTSPQLEIRARERPYPGWAGYGVDHTLPPARGSLRELIMGAGRANLRPVAVARGENLDRYLGIFDELNQQIPISDRRFVLVHVEYADARQQDLMRRLGVVPTIHAGFLWKRGLTNTANASAAQLATYLPLRSYVERGIPFVLATDNVPVSPFRALWAAVARKDEATGAVIVPEQRISREEALRAMTINGAYLTFDEHERGSIELGKLADLAVLTDDYLTVPEDAIKDLEAVMTMVGGQVVYTATQ